MYLLQVAFPFADIFPFPKLYSSSSNSEKCSFTLAVYLIHFCSPGQTTVQG